MIRYPCLSIFRCFQSLRETKTGPSRSHRVRSLIGPDRLRTLAHGSAYAPMTRTVRMQLAAPAVPSSSFDEVRPASCCWCRSPCRSHSRNHSSRPASTASLSTSKETSCGPLVCLCYTRVAMHGRSFPSARVIVVVLPLPSVLNVFSSVEPTTVVNVCGPFAGFEQS